MSTSGNHQVVVSATTETTPGAGSPLVEGLVEVPIVPAGSTTLRGVADPVGAVPAGGNLLGEVAETLGPVSAGSTVEGDIAEVDGPLSGGSNALQDEADAMAGNIQGRPNSGLAHTAPGGLGVSLGGSPVSEREEINLVSGGGITYEVSDDSGNDRTDVSGIVEAEIELARQTVDLVAAGSVVLVGPVASPLVGLEITRISVRTLTVDTPGTAPQISLQALAAADILSATTVTPTAEARLQSILANVESAFVGVGNSVTLVKDVLSTAVTYSVEIALYGRQRR